MQPTLSAGASAIEWIVAGYGLDLRRPADPAGRLGDRIGRRRVFSLGLRAVHPRSAACGLAPTPEHARRRPARPGRRRRAADAAACCRSSASSTRARTALRALSAYGTVMGLAAVGGQLIGGVLIAGRPRRPRLAQRAS